MIRENALNKVRGYLTDYLPIESVGEIDEIIKALEQEPCENCVSKAEIECYLHTYLEDGRNVVKIEDLLHFIGNLPSAYSVFPKDATNEEVLNLILPENAYISADRRGQVHIRGINKKWLDMLYRGGTK